ncbi:MAG TPA: multiheme c-type cytochrome [Verrucomicrobiae bacterium]|nr:multiheme c-type cytochrome [Verrucomicrobiae bacterium]
MHFRGVFIAIAMATAMIVAAYLVNSRRPRVVVEQPSAALIRASGKCAECHRNAQYSIVHEFEMSVHARKGVNCLDCHQVAAGQQGTNHNGFVINTAVTPANCRTCHEAIYQQFLHSRHAAASWAAVAGDKDFTPEQVAFGEHYQPGAVKRPPNALTTLEGAAATTSGCASCHSVGRPNPDGTIGNCTACHTRHTSSVELARLPSTCGQCHLGPDHSQMEIYTESKHGVMFAAQRQLLNLSAPPDKLTTHDMFVPTCATCHMSGINGTGVTHDPSERLSYYLFAEVTKPRPDAARAQAKMKNICLQCHTPALVDRVYREADEVVKSTNEKVLAAKAIMDQLQQDGLLKGEPYSQPIAFKYFDLWHYYGRTAKHGAFMGGADFVQWHGNYPILQHLVEIRAEAEQLRQEHAAGR